MISPQPQVQEARFDRALRPRHLAGLIGQDRVRENLSILIDAAKTREEALAIDCASEP